MHYDQLMYSQLNEPLAYGPTSENILGAGLPTNEVVLKYFFFSSQRQGMYDQG